jgi:hypothetical protein
MDSMESQTLQTVFARREVGVTVVTHGLSLRVIAGRP